MIFKLRDYQQAAIAKVLGLLAKKRCKAVLLQSPVGSGKTVMAASMAAVLRVPTLFVAHRVELLEQMATTAEHMGVDIHTRSIAAAANMPAAKLRTYGLVIIDECHRTGAASYRALVGKCQHAPIIGITATPCRTDSRALLAEDGGVYDQVVQAATMEALIADGTIARPRVFAAANGIDPRKLSVRGGEFSHNTLQNEVENTPLNGNVVDHYKRLAQGESALVFAVSVEHAESLTKRFERAGVTAACVHGRLTKVQRKLIMDGFKQRKFAVLVNVDICTEGWDWPPLSCLILATSTASPIRYAQMVGRVMRRAPFKKQPLIIDHGNNVYMHGMPHAQTWRTVKKSGNGDMLGYAKTCPGCEYVSPLGSKECPECGFEFSIDSRKRDRRIKHTELPVELTEVLPEAASLGLQINDKGCWLVPRGRRVNPEESLRRTVAKALKWDLRNAPEGTPLTTFCHERLCVNPHHLWVGRPLAEVKEACIAFLSERTPSGCLRLNNNNGKAVTLANATTEADPTWPDGERWQAYLRKRVGLLTVRTRFELRCGNDWCIEPTHVNVLQNNAKRLFEVTIARGRTIKSESCLIWTTGDPLKERVLFKGQKMSVKRAAYVAETGNSDCDLRQQTLHMSCNNPFCVNGAHMWVR